MAEPGPVLVLGIGNPQRGDDGAGRAAASALREILDKGVDVIEADGETTELLERLEGASAAVIVDACASGGEPGALHRFDVSDAPLPQTGFIMSSHGFGLHEAIELARALGQLPRPCIVFAIEGRTFDVGAPMTPAVAAAAEQAAALVRDEISRIEGLEVAPHA